MSHDNRVYLNTTLNNVVVIDSDQNQITVTHPVTQVIEITQSPTPTVTVVEETPNNVSVTEAVGNTVIVSATGPQGIQGIRGADPELTALEQFTGSIQTQVNLLRAATSSYVQNSQTASMLQPYVLTSSTGSMLQPYVLTTQTASMLQPYVLTSQTSSMTVLSSSYAITASYALNISEINTAAFVVTSSFNSYTGSVQTQINNINNATSSYVQNDQTGSMLQPYVLTSRTGSMLQPYVLTLQTSSMSVATSSLALTASFAPNYVLTDSTSSMSVRSAGTASRLEGMFSLTANSSANNRTISSIGGLAFNNNAAIDQDGARSLIFRTTPDGNVGSLAARLTISGSGQIGINATPYISSSLIVSGGVILNGTASYFQNYDSWPVQLHAGQIGNGIGIYSDVVGQYSYGTSSPYYQFGRGGSATWRLATSTEQGFFIQNIQPSLNTRVYVSASGFVGIGTTVPDSNLHVFKGLSGAAALGLQAGTTLTLENNTTNYINFKTPNGVVAGLAFSTPADSSAGYISLRQSTGEMFYSTENANGYHTFFTADTERLRVANTETTVRNNLIVSGTTSQFTASGTSLFNNEVDIFGTSSSLNISGSTVGGVTINVSSSLPTQPALLISQVGTGSALTVSNGYVNLGYATTHFTGGRLNISGNVYILGRIFFQDTTNQTIEGSSPGRALMNFSNGNSYLNNGNLGLGTITPTQRLTVVGSSSFSGDVTISNLLTLTPRHPLPTLNLTAGAFAVSSSTPPKPYFYDGTSWNALY